MVHQTPNSNSHARHFSSVSYCPVRTAIHRHALRGLAHVSYEIHERVVILKGNVSTYYHKQLAQEVVKNLDEVDLVVNRLIVSFRKVDPA